MLRMTMITWAVAIASAPAVWAAPRAPAPEVASSRFT
jgi:hypothetical protein